MELALRIILIFLMISLTALIFYKSKLEKSRFKLGLLSLSITYWIISFEMLRMAVTTTEVMFWAKSIFVAAPSALVSMFTLSREFREERVINKKIHSRIMYAIYFVVVAAVLFTDKIITVGDPTAVAIADKAPIGKYYIFCIIFYMYLTSYYFLNLVLAYLRNPKQRIKVFYMALSTLLTLTITLITTGVLPLLNINYYVWLAPYSTAIFIGTLAYSVLRYRLFDIDLLIRRLIVLLVLSTVVILINKLTFILLAIESDSIVSAQLVYIVTVNLFLLAIFYFNHNNLELFTKQLIARKKEDYFNAVVNAINELNRNTKVEELVEDINSIFVEKMEVTGTAVYLKENQNNKLMVKKTKGVHDLGFPADIETDNELIDYLKKHHRIIDKEELKHKLKYQLKSEEEKRIVRSIIRILDSTYKSTISIPLIPRDEVVGIIFLQSKKSGYQYTNAELLLLKTLAFNVSTLLDNIMLQQKTIHNEKLALIGTMASSFAHEIRNPLTSVSAYMGMLPNRLGDDKFMAQFLSIVPAEVDRVAKLTTDLMGFAKGSETNLISLDMRILIERITKLVKNEVNKKNITIDVGIEGNTRTVADENQLYQVLLNIVINALQASSEGQTIRINVTNINAHTEIVIKDEGDGIDAVNLPKVFEPFYSTKIYGTGLGLATCKRIIEAHKGTIAVESEKGKGSTFTICIPNRLAQQS